MVDELSDWVVALIPFRVFLALLALFLICAALLVVWAVYG